MLPDIACTPEQGRAAPGPPHRRPGRRRRRRRSPAPRPAPGPPRGRAPARRRPRPRPAPGPRRRRPARASAARRPPTRPAWRGTCPTARCGSRPPARAPPGRPRRQAPQGPRPGFLRAAARPGRAGAAGAGRARPHAASTRARRSAAPAPGTPARAATAAAWPQKDHVTHLVSSRVADGIGLAAAKPPGNRAPDQAGAAARPALCKTQAVPHERGRAAARLYVDAQNAAAPRGRAQRLTRHLQPAAGRAAEHQHAAACGARAVWQRTQGALALPPLVLFCSLCTISPVKADSACLHSTANQHAACPWHLGTA